MKITRPVFGSLQIWYDDPESLQHKYKMAQSLELRGIGFWHLDTLAYGPRSSPVQRRQTAAMWKAVGTFTGTSDQGDDEQISLDS